MRSWWERWPGRREAELASFRRHGLAFRQEEEAFRAGRLVLRGSIAVDGENVELVVVYPDSYPWTRFTVAAPSLALPRHQHPFGKNLCVFPRASEHWNRTWLAGDIVIDRVPDLIRVVRRGGETLRDAEEPVHHGYTHAGRGRPAGEPPALRRRAGPWAEGGALPSAQAPGRRPIMGA